LKNDKYLEVQFFKEAFALLPVLEILQKLHFADQKTSFVLTLRLVVLEM